MIEFAKDLAESMKTAFLGMGITILSLYLLSLLLDLIRVVFHNPASKQKSEPLPAPDREEVPPQQRTEEGEWEELVAVITAAISSYLQKPTDRIKIGFIRRIHERTPIWGMESRLNPME